MSIKKGYKVIVITGKHKGDKGTILRVTGERVIVEGINKAKIHHRPKNTNEKGSIVERELSIHISNVKLDK